MKRTDMVMAGADRLFATEEAVDRALTETGELIATLTRLRVTGNLSAVYGQDAIDAIMGGAMALSSARGHFVRAHGHLDRVKTQLGCKTMASGTLQPKPDDDKEDAGVI
jgi:hypothetical protein